MKRACGSVREIRLSSVTFTQASRDHRSMAPVYAQIGVAKPSRSASKQMRADTPQSFLLCRGRSGPRDSRVFLFDAYVSFVRSFLATVNE